MEQQHIARRLTFYIIKRRQHCHQGVIELLGILGQSLCRSPTTQGPDLGRSLAGLLKGDDPPAYRVLLDMVGLLLLGHLTTSPHSHAEPLAVPLAFQRRSLTTSGSSQTSAESPYPPHPQLANRPLFPAPASRRVALPASILSEYSAP